MWILNKYIFKCIFLKLKKGEIATPLSGTRARSPIFTFNSLSKSVDTLRISVQSCSKSSFVVWGDVIVKLEDFQLISEEDVAINLF